MFKLDHFKFLLGLVCIVFFVVPGPVYGYIDPGTGSLIIQAIAAAIIAVPFALKVYWKRIRDFFFKKS